MWRLLLDFLYPKMCLSCGAFGNYICETCGHKLLQKQWLQKCHVCKSETFRGFVHIDCVEETYLDGVVVGYFYNDFAKKLVKEVKYHYSFAVVEDICMWLVEVLATYHLQVQAVTAVPVSRFRKWQRGFNQAELLGRGVARILKLPYQEILLRTKNTRTQVGQSKGERVANLQGAFAVRHGSTLPTSVLLVDDVMTTGTTLEQCARTLKESGVERVYGCVFARGG